VAPLRPKPCAYHPWHEVECMGKLRFAPFDSRGQQPALGEEWLGALAEQTPERVVEGAFASHASRPAASGAQKAIWGSSGFGGAGSSGASRGGTAGFSSASCAPGYRWTVLRRLTPLRLGGGEEKDSNSNWATSTSAKTGFGGHVLLLLESMVRMGPTAFNRRKTHQPGSFSDLVDAARGFWKARDSQSLPYLGDLANARALGP
jgi:hypothetical protein